MDNQYLQEVSDEKDLGIMITSDLKSAAQVVEASKKANRALGMISRTIKYKSKSVLLSLYKSLVRPHLEYCTPVWSVASPAIGHWDTCPPWSLCKL